MVIRIIAIMAPHTAHTLHTHFAVRLVRLPIVLWSEQGVEQQINLHMKSELGATPLHLAAATGSTEMVRLLLDKGADPNVRKANGSTPLKRAAEASGDAGLEVARLLLEAGADVNSQEESGAAPLHFACMFSNVKVAELLLEHGADQHLRGTRGDAKAYAEDAVCKEEMLAQLAVLRVVGE